MTEPRLFHLQRDHDVSGVSGTGRVANGVLWPDGTVSLRWIGDRPSTVHWDRLADAEAVHGHGGATRIVWDDEQPAVDRAAVYAEVAERLSADAEQGDKEGLTRIYRRSAAKQVREWADELRRMADETQHAPVLTLTREQLASLLAHHADVLAANLRTDATTGLPEHRAGVERAAELLSLHAEHFTAEEECGAAAEFLDAAFEFPKWQRRMAAEHQPGAGARQDGAQP